MTILSIPKDDINLSGNLPDIVITADQPVSVRLICEGDILIDENYTPDANNRIRFNINDVVKSLLHFTMPVSDVQLQADLVKSFVLELNDESHNFKALRAGINVVSLTVKQWLASHFLTWQPQEKEILQKQAEWLSYYATENCELMVKAHFKDGTHSIKSLFNLADGNAYTFNVCYGHIANVFGNLPVYYDVWVQNTSVQLSYVQRFILKRKPAEHIYFAFENSLGGFDVACFSGENIHKPEYEPKSATIEGVVTDYNTSKADVYRQSTGWLSKDESMWLHDFFASEARYLAAAGALLPISLSEATPEESNKNDLRAFEFSYKIAKSSVYLNIIRNYTVLPENISIIDPANIPFDLAPRLVDFPEILLSDIALFPVQSPFEEKWHRASLGALVDYMESAIAGSGMGEASHAHSNLPVLNSLAISSGYLYSAGNKIKAGFADKSDVSAYAYFAENAHMWDGHVWDDWIDQSVRANDDVIHKSLSAPVFVSGFAGSGWQMDEDARMTVDYLTVRKQMDVYSLVVNKIRATNGSIWVSDVSEYRCYIDSDSGKNPVPFRANDIIRCQQWAGKNIKYYSARIGSVTNDCFTLIKSTFDGSGIPAAYDEVVRIGSSSDTNRQGAIYLTASDNNAPYIDVLDGVVSSSFANKTKARLGKLIGITDVAFGGALSGYGLYADNAYIKGKIHVTGGNAAKISDIDSSLADAKNYTDALQNGLGALAWDSKVELAKLGTTIIQGGFIKSNLIEVNAIKISGSFATTADVNTSVTNAVNEIVVGGRNLLLKSDLFDGNWHLAYMSKIKKDNYLRFNSLGNRADAHTYLWDNLKGEYLIENIDIGVEYMFSVDIRTNAPSYTVGLRKESPSQIFYPATATPIQEQWFRHKLLINFNAIIWTNILWVVGIVASTASNFHYIEVKNWKIEKGNKATSWSPAPEDVQADAQSKVNTLKNSLGALAWDSKVEVAKLGTTLIEGGFIKANLINVNAIKISGGLATTNDVNNSQNTTINALTKGKRFNVGSFTFNSSMPYTTTVGLNTKIPFTTNMWLLEISGYAYGNALPIKLQIVFYSYPSSNSIIYTGYTNEGAFSISAVRLALKNNLIAVELTVPEVYYLNIEVQLVSVLHNSAQSVANDWTTHTGFDSSYSIITNVPTKKTVLENSLGALAWDSKVELAKLGTTVIEGGYLKTNLINVNWLKANVVTSAYISALAVDFKQGKIGGFNITASSIASANGKIVLNQDGSGSFASDKFRFDTNGNIFLQGRISTQFKSLTPPLVSGGNYYHTLNLESNYWILNYNNANNQKKTFYLTGTKLDGMIIYFLIRNTEIEPNTNVAFFVSFEDQCGITVHKGTHVYYANSLIGIMWIEQIKNWVEVSRKDHFYTTR